MSEPHEGFLPEVQRKNTVAAAEAQEYRAGPRAVA